MEKYDYKDELRALKVMRYTTFELKKLQDYEISFLKEREKELGLKILRCIEKIKTGEIRITKNI